MWPSGPPRTSTAINILNIDLVNYSKVRLNNPTVTFGWDDVIAMTSFVETRKAAVRVRARGSTWYKNTTRTQIKVNFLEGRQYRYSKKSILILDATILSIHY